MGNYGRTIRPNDRWDCVRLATSEEGKAYDKLPMMESELSNASHANATDIIEAMNTTSRPDSFFNSYWVVPVTIIVFLAAIFLTNSCLGL